MKEIISNLDGAADLVRAIETVQIMQGATIFILILLVILTSGKKQ